jgi:hypothetical protein
MALIAAEKPPASRWLRMRNVRLQEILIADGSIYAVLDLAQSIEANEGCVAGPVSLISEALTIVAHAR